MRKSQSYRMPHRFKKKKPVWQNRFFWSGLLTVFILGSIFYIFIFSDLFKVKEINIAGAQSISQNEARSIAENNLETRILFFKTKNILLANLPEIKKDLQKAFPQIADLKIERHLFNAININITERTGNIIWCQTDMNKESCFLVDGNGVVFQENPPENNLMKIIDKVNGPLSLGDKVIDAVDLVKIATIQEKIKEALKTDIQDFVVLNDRFTVETSEGWSIYFDLKGDTDWQLTKLSAVLQEKIPPEKRHNLDYIELRFGNMAPFKYRSSQSNAK